MLKYIIGQILRGQISIHCFDIATNIRCLPLCFHNHSWIVLMFQLILNLFDIFKIFITSDNGARSLPQGNGQVFEIAKSHRGTAPLISFTLNMHPMRIILLPQIFDISTHGIRICIKRKKITYGKFFDFWSEKCVYN